MARIPQEILDEIASRTNIVDVIARYVPLKRSGSNYMGLCPFHHEKTPSFSVSESKQIFHCFGCGAGGNVFKFLMDIEHISFPDAARLLAKEADVTIPERTLTPQEKKAQAEKALYYHINEVARTYYQKVLTVKEGDIYKNYLQSRGIDATTIERFQLGGCLPNRWDGLVRYLMRESIPLDKAEILGLVAKRRDGKGYYDRFRDRLMFPIVNEKGRTVAFGGRILDKEKAPQKYLNSQETPLFHKGSMLYGMHTARKAIREEDCAILVEGYMDVLTMYQFGFHHVVAPLGTALTEEQMKLLMRHTYRFVTSFDGDQAGRRANLRALDIADKLGARMQVVIYPDGKDPDEYLHTEGKEAMQQLLSMAQDGIGFRLDEAMRSTPIQGSESVLQILNTVLPHLHTMQHRVDKENAVQYIAKTLGLSSQVVWEELRLNERDTRRSKARFQQEIPEPEKKHQPPSAAFKDEALLFAILVDEKELLKEFVEKGYGNLFVTDVKRLYLHIHECPNGTEDPALHMDDTLSALYAKAMAVVPSYDKDQARSLFEQLIHKMRLAKLAQEEKQATEALTQCEASGNMEAIVQAMQTLDRLRKERQQLLENPMRGEH